MFCQSGFEFFKNVLSMSQANYLEIGVFNGDSLQGLARAYPNRAIYGVDPFIEDGNTEHTTGVKRNESMPVQKANTLNNIQGYTNIKLYEQTSRAFSDALSDALVKELDIGYVLIDGSHHYEDVIEDVHMAMRLIGNKPGAIVFDDVNLPGVGPAYQEFKQLYSGLYGPAIDIYPAEPGHIIAHMINPVKEPELIDNK